MTTHIQITNKADSNPSQNLVVSATGTCSGAIHRQLVPGEHVEFWMTDSAKLTIYEIQAPPAPASD